MGPPSPGKEDDIETQIRRNLARIRTAGVYSIDPWQQKPGVSTITQDAVLDGGDA
jgi:hypothetical protein